VTAAADEFWCVPIPVWNLAATLLLALLTAVYVLLTRRTVKSTEKAALAALASVEIELEASLFVTPFHDLPKIVQVRTAARPCTCTARR
jgi:hypothetical protein